MQSWWAYKSSLKNFFFFMFPNFWYVAYCMHSLYCGLCIFFLVIWIWLAWIWLARINKEFCLPKVVSCIVQRALGSSPWAVSQPVLNKYRSPPSISSSVSAHESERTHLDVEDAYISFHGLRILAGVFGKKFDGTGGLLCNYGQLLWYKRTAMSRVDDEILDQLG